jgi:hypothetical protein
MKRAMRSTAPASALTAPLSIASAVRDGKNAN